MVAKKKTAKQSVKQDLKCDVVLDKDLIEQIARLRADGCQWSEIMPALGLDRPYYYTTIFLQRLHEAGVTDRVKQIREDALHELLYDRLWYVKEMHNLYKRCLTAVEPDFKTAKLCLNDLGKYFNLIDTDDKRPGSITIDAEYSISKILLDVERMEAADESQRPN